MPLVSIGMPVYNAESTIRAAVDSLLAQTFSDFELIISDNASTDATEVVCREYAVQDARVKYFRQTTNLGPILNFQFVLSRAVGLYFMWNAADDRRSADFLEANVCALQSEPCLSASTSSNCYEGEEGESDKHVRFDLRGNCAERYENFLRNAWISHGIFYSLMRIELIRSYRFPKQTYAAQDWSVNLFLLSLGQINRAKSGLTIIGRNGMSRKGNPWLTFRNHPIEKIFPLYEFSRYVFSLLLELRLREIRGCIILLIKLNLVAIQSNLSLTLKSIVK